MTCDDPIVIVNYARTPLGAFGGELSSLKAVDLGAAAIKASIEKSKIKSDDIDEVIMGMVLSAGVGQAPARQASIKAGISNSKPCTTINKMCGSGMKAIMLAHDQIKSGSSNIIIAGGMESMSNAPYLLPKARSGMRMGHGEVLDHMLLDGLEDAYDQGKLMGVFADNTAKEYNFSREQQDNFAIESIKRAQNAIEKGLFKQEITPIEVNSRKHNTVVENDESPFKAKIDKIPKLKPAFSKDGSVTAANASSISDGAAAVVLMRESEAKKRNLDISAKIVAHSSSAHKPEWFTTAPVNAIKDIYLKTGWDNKQVDLYEINEAFAVVTMAAMKDLNLEHEKVNIHGGACALGHPIGASGARIIVSLISALKQNNKTKGIATLCIGGGEAVAIALELN